MRMTKAEINIDAREGENVSYEVSVEKSQFPSPTKETDLLKLPEVKNDA